MTCNRLNRIVINEQVRQVIDVPLCKFNERKTNQLNIYCNESYNKHRLSIRFAQSRLQLALRQSVNAKRARTNDNPSSTRIWKLVFRAHSTRVRLSAAISVFWHIKFSFRSLLALLCAKQEAAHGGMSHCSNNKSKKRTRPSDEHEKTTKMKEKNRVGIWFGSWILGHMSHARTHHFHRLCVFAHMHMWANTVLHSFAIWL